MGETSKTSRVVQHPKCTAMLLCDKVQREPRTGRKTIKGTFDRLVAPPGQPITTRFQVYAALTDALGKIPLEMRVVSAESGIVDAEDVQFTSKLVADFTQPLATTAAIFDVRITFPKPGVYRCVLLSGNIEIMAKRLVVNEVAQP